jgi:hypothetical protein
VLLAENERKWGKIGCGFCEREGLVRKGAGLCTVEGGKWLVAVVQVGSDRFPICFWLRGVSGCFGREKSKPGGGRLFGKDERKGRGGAAPLKDKGLGLGFFFFVFF